MIKFSAQLPNGLRCSFGARRMLVLTLAGPSN